MNPRYSERKLTSAKVTLSAGPRVGEGQVLDLTVPGCLLETKVPLEAGQAVQLRIHLDTPRPMRIDLGIVRWVSKGNAGVEFVRMSQDDSLRLRFVVGYIDKRNRVSAGWSVAPLCVGY